jgi:hypothetical protein
MRNKKLLDYITKKLVDDLKALKGSPSGINKNISWYKEIEVIYTKQVITETFENESNSLSKI